MLLTTLTFVGIFLLYDLITYRRKGKALILDLYNWFYDAKMPILDWIITKVMEKKKNGNIKTSSKGLRATNNKKYQ